MEPKPHRVKPSILFTIPNFETAGSGHALYQLALGLHQGGYDVHIMAKHDRGRLVEAIRKFGINFHIWDYESPARPLNHLWKHAKATAKKFRSINPDIIYSYHYSSDYTEALSAKLAGIPWMYVKKNMSWYGPSQNAWYLRSLLAKRINVQNTEMETEFLYRFSKKLSHISIGVDANKFKPLHTGKYDAFTFIHISSLLPVKGIEVLVDAYKLFCKSHAGNHQLLIVGPDDSEYINKVKTDFRDYSSIKFTGKQKGINLLLNQSHCFVQSSLNEGRREGAPIALQEAMATELLCIGSRVAGINDQLRGFEELQYDARDVQALAALMGKVINMSPEQRVSIGKKMRERILTHYSLKKEIEDTKHLISQLIA